MSSCAAPNPSVLSSGTLVWSSGNRLYELGGPAGEKKRLILSLPDGTIVESLTKVDSRRIVFSSYSLNVRPFPAALKNKLWMFNISTHKLTKLGEGRAPAYIKKYQELAFHAPYQEDRKADLLVGDLNGSLTNIQKIHEGPFSFNAPPTQISDDEIVLEMYRNRRHHVLKYDFGTDQWTVLPISTCRPILWRAATQQLLCALGDSFNYYLIALDGQHVQKLKNFGTTSFFVYLQNLDAALATRPGISWPPEREDIWIYYFKTGNWEKVMEGAGAAQGAAVWIEEKRRKGISTE